MKKSIIMIVALAFGLFACAQNPPKAVSKNFNKKFTTATKVKWDQEEENEWEAEFVMNGNEMSASFDAHGKWMATEGRLKEKDLPVKVEKAVKAAYGDWDIEAVESIEKPGFKGYEIGIEKGKEEKEILVTANGKIKVNKESEEEENEEDEK